MRAQKRELSPAAQVAKLCRQYLKGKGIKCSATSENYSMGNSVNVKVFNQSPDVMKMINDEFAQYQGGHFNGMEDIYEYSNSRNDIPQTKYLFVSNEISDELKQQAWEWLRAKYPGNGDSLPSEYSEASRLQWSCDYWNHDDLVEQNVRKILNGSGIGLDADNSVEFWESLKVVALFPEKLASNATAHIEEHEHTKKGFTMYIVILDSRVDRDEFNALRDACKDAGGWYSRQWGSTPGGFAFESKEMAESFLASLGSDTPNNEPPMPSKHNGDKLRTMADKMQNAIDDKLADRQTNTAKRLAQANHARFEGERLKRTQSALYALADLHDSGNVPPILAGIGSKKAVYELMGESREMVPNGYHSYSVGTGEPNDTSPQALALWALLKGESEESKQAKELQRKIEGLQFSKIPGYFPTPDAVIDLMLDYANLKESDRVLEPNLGSCAIADRVAPLCAEVKGFEVNHTLAEIADAKDYLIDLRDFLTVSTEEITSYDRVLMNPPFENLQDIDHVQHAFKFLKDGGRLVSVMSPSPFYNSNKKAEAFRQWFEDLGGEKIDLPAGSFKESGTGVNSIMVVIDN